MTIGLTYSTDGGTMNTIVQEIKRMLQEHANISQKDTLLVTFESFGDSA